MCDYSLQNVASRPAKVGDKLVVRNFGTGTNGFAPAEEEMTGGCVCVLPGTEIAFDRPIEHFAFARSSYATIKSEHRTAIFRQVAKGNPHAHHDAIEFPDGTATLLTLVIAGQHATVLQLPAMPRTEAEAEEQRRAEYVG